MHLATKLVVSIVYRVYIADSIYQVSENNHHIFSTDVHCFRNLILMVTIVVGRRLGKMPDVNMEREFEDIDFFHSLHRMSSIQGAKRHWNIIR